MQVGLICCRKSGFSGDKRRIAEKETNDGQQLIFSHYYNKMHQISIELKPNIKTYDIDVAGHVNNIVYLKWFENLRTKLFNKHFNLKALMSANLYPVVISTNIKYKRFLKLFDKPVGRISFIGFNHSIIKLKFEIKVNGKIAVLGEQTCVLMNLKTETMDKQKFKSIIKI
jgi:acyl-CoA thioester hydrolase